MRAVTIDSDLATLFTFTPRKPPITPIQEVRDQAIFFLVPGLRGSSPKDGQLHSAPPTIIGGRH